MSKPLGAKFALARPALALPSGASAQAPRTLLTADGRPLLGFNQGRFRPYLHPVFTPRGFCATAEHPADHPHHTGIWVAADRVSWWADGGPEEEHTYNFYVDDTFQGRAPGSIDSNVPRMTENSRDSVRVEQTCVWRGPPEWGASRGRAVAVERRTITVHPGERWNVIDMESALEPRLGRLRIGPTRHAWFNARLADAIVASGGRLAVSDHTPGGAPAWIDLSGALGGGHRGGIAMLRLETDSATGWFAKSWGVVTLQPFVHEPRDLPLRNTLRLAARFIVHDEDMNPDDLDSLASST